MLSICHGVFWNLLVQKAALYGCQVISVSLCVCLFVSLFGNVCSFIVLSAMSAHCCPLLLLL
jgi:hypothetical protein